MRLISDHGSYIDWYPTYPSGIRTSFIMDALLSGASISASVPLTARLEVDDPEDYARSRSHARIERGLSCDSMPITDWRVPVSCSACDSSSKQHPFTSSPLFLVTSPITSTVRQPPSYQKRGRLCIRLINRVCFVRLVILLPAMQSLVCAPPPTR